LIYGVNAYSVEAQVSSNTAETDPITIDFTEPLINTYLVPIGSEAQTIKAFMDGAFAPNWTDNTETKYYQTKGSSKPIAITNELQKYKEGSIQVRFFDSRFNGQGISGADQLAAIKNLKPILLRTWWGKNYYISIDGTIRTTRKAGIGWYCEFSFTEINL
jgi:hypothetical protein